MLHMKNRTHIHLPYFGPQPGLMLDNISKLDALKGKTVGHSATSKSRRPGACLFMIDFCQPLVEDFFGGEREKIGTRHESKGPPWRKKIKKIELFVAFYLVESDSGFLPFIH